MHKWDLIPGDPLDGAYVGTFLDSAKRDDPELRKMLTDVLTRYEMSTAPSSREVNLVIHLEKP